MFCNLFVKFSCVLFVLLLAQDCHSLDKVEATGDGCNITDPLYNATFNFGALHTDLSHSVALGQGSSIEFNVCGGISKECNGTKGVAACVTTTSKDKDIVLGTGHTLKLTNGRFQFDFMGEKCTNDKNWTLSVILDCDYTSVKNPFSIVKTNDKCSYSVIYRTKLACGPSSFKSLDSCSVPLNNVQSVNLYQLANVNHVVDDRNGGTFLINICNPVHWDLDVMCPVGSGVCFINNTENDLTKKFRNLGTIEKPTVNKGEISIKMDSPETCPLDPKKKISSLITFRCDKSTKVDEVEFIGFHDCQYLFAWQTKTVCDNSEPCTAVDPKTGAKYDLRELSKKPYNVSHDNHTYTFGICSAPGHPCLESSGACEINPAETTALGLANDKILINETGSPYLKYENGGLCKENKQHSYTIIEFVCAEQGMETGPKIIENTGCRLIIQFVTQLVCSQTQISCQTNNGSYQHVINLTPLISFTENYVANVSSGVKDDNAKSKYFINVCRPLVPQYGLSCPGGSAICQATIENGKPESEKSLGYPDVSLTMVNTPLGSRAQLKYLRGSVCPADNATQLSSSIDFYCDPKVGRGNPVLKAIVHDCFYEFEWATNVICPIYNCEFSKKHCSIHNDETDKEFDLMDLVKSNSELTAIKFCELDKYQVEADYAQGSVKVFTMSKEKCGDMNIQLKLNCNGEERNFTTKNDEHCSLLVTYETPSICSMLGLQPPEKASPPPPSVTTPKSPEDGKDNKTDSGNSHDGDKKSGGGVSTVGAIFIVMAVFGAVGGIGFALKDPERRAKLFSLIRRKDTNVSYSRDFGDHYDI
ncbi:cation-independent mannose-6-phosphate receptor isoform X2 [Phlebotomus papatasi]|uniref:cation-independent mannose-6-phosphate receptor isoform X2 n=1 Tax=Phlebotomus papatasi TaxID=29031 RepID=UPI0024837947|nr:cation-independent mannose-6-phosphate receptor isoform X2 [Phlebotomus papatasi]